MPLDAYSRCPGGRDKKLKFCCPDLLGELNEIERMIEAEQYVAALREVERLNARKPDCACLMVHRQRMLRELDRSDEALDVAERLAEIEPHNALAWAELAVCRVLSPRGSAASALDAWLNSIEQTKERGFVETLQAMVTVAYRLLSEGQLVPAIALAYFYDVNSQERESDSLWLRLQRAPGIPPLLKAIPFFRDCPDDVSWKAEYDAAIARIDELAWRDALAGLGTLTDKADEFPWVWQAIAMLRLWLLDTDGAIDALRRLAASNIDVEDAVEARLFSLFLSEDPLGDSVGLNNVVYQIEDFDRAQESLLSWDQAVTAPFDPAEWDTEEKGPAPRKAFVLFDLPKVNADTEPDPALIPKHVCDALLFGKETDRPARLMLMSVASNARPQIEESLRGLLGQALGEMTEEREQTAESSSATYMALQPRWHIPQWSDRENVGQLRDRFRDRFLLESWPNQPVAALGGRTPREAAADPQGRIDVLAMIYLLEHWSERSLGSFDFNLLREQLGLPRFETLEPINYDGVMRLSPVRLRRLAFAEMKDEALAAVFARAQMTEDGKTLLASAEAIVRRESLASHPLRLRAYFQLALHAETMEQGFDWLEQGRKACAEQGASCAQFDLIEIPMRARSGQPQPIPDLIQHIYKNHMQEPGVAEQLAQLLVALGIMRPDGTLVPARKAGRAATQVDGGGLWTPDAAAQPVDKSSTGESKLWTPDMG